MKKGQKDIVSKLTEDIAHIIEDITGIIKLPSVLEDDKKGIEHIAQLSHMLKETKEKRKLFYVLDCSATDKMSVSAITFLICFIHDLEEKIFLFCEDKIIEGNNQIIDLLIEKYIKKSEDLTLWNTYNFEEDYYLSFLNEELSSYNLKEEQKIKLLLSELFTNIKMHSNSKIGSVMVSAHSEKIVFCITNIDITIKENITRKKEFLLDEEAIIWALKKGKSTRKKVSGGLGFYYLRKFLAELGGRFTIVSGNARLQFDREFFNPKDERIVISSSEKERRLDNKFRGNLFLIEIPYLKEVDIKQNNEENVTTFRLKDMRS